MFAADDLRIAAIQDEIIRCIFPLCTGTNEDDIIIGSFLNETISSLNGNDKIQGNNGNDAIFGGKGNDIIQGGGGFDRLFGEDGNDILVSDAEISLVGEILPQIFDEIEINSRIIELLLGISSSAPVINGTLLDGGNGDDNLIGQSGNENFVGGPGHDYFNCEEGTDTILDYNAKEDTADINCENLE